MRTTRTDGTELGDLFMSVARDLRRRQAHALEPFGLTPSESRALRVLSRHQPVRLGDLAAQLRVVPRSATDVVDALERSGLVARSADPADRRATLLSLTSTGAALLDEIGAARQREVNGFFDRLSAADRAALTGVLARLQTD